MRAIRLGFGCDPRGWLRRRARGAAQLAGARDVFLTHGHLDHALGVPGCFPRAAPPPGPAATRVFCPGPLAETLGASSRPPRRRARAGAGTSYQPCRVSGRATRSRSARGLDGRGVRHSSRGDQPGLPPGGDPAATGRALPRCGVGGAGRAARTRCRDLRALRAVAPFLLRGHGARGVRGASPASTTARCWWSSAPSWARPCAPRVPPTATSTSRTWSITPASPCQAIVLHHLSRRHRLAQLRRAVDERLPRLAGRVWVLSHGATLGPPAGGSS